jgi:hypothetical protein
MTALPQAQTAQPARARLAIRLRDFRVTRPESESRPSLLHAAEPVTARRGSAPMLVFGADGHGPRSRSRAAVTVTGRGHGPRLGMG